MIYDDDEILTVESRRREDGTFYPPVISYNLALIRTMTEQEREETLAVLKQAEAYIKGESHLLNADEQSGAY